MPPHFTAPDGTHLAYHISGDGIPLICIPGGPMTDPTYLGDLGGLNEHCQLIILNLRGTGDSDRPADLTTCRADRQAADVEALRIHLGLERIVLLGHSAGANIAIPYATAYPDRLAALVLSNPSTFSVGINATADQRREMVRLRRHEPWYEPAAAAYERIASGEATEADWEAITPFAYGRWDEAARAHAAATTAGEHADLAAAFRADGAFDPPANKTALSTLDVPVLFVAGETDISGAPKVMVEFAELFPDARVSVQPAAGHFPWVDDPAAYVSTVADFVNASG